MIVVAFVLLNSLVAASQCFAADRPNIVYILADDLGNGDVGCFNPDCKIPTPYIDSIASRGMRFTDAHSPSAVCTPTRYGILTGRYCWRTELKKGVLGGYSKPLIEPGRMTVASFLHDHGYATACIGKWHLGLGWHQQPGAEGRAPGENNIDFSQPTSAGPQTVGFEYSFIIPASLDMAPYLYLENGKAVELPTQHIGDSPRPAYFRGGPIAPSFKHQTCLLELTKKAQSFIQERAAKKDQPFFLYMALTSPHTPHVPRDEFKGKSHAGNYGDFVVETDWSIGQIVDSLSKNGLTDNTLLIITSDNGAHSEPLHLEEQFDHHANYIFRGQKSDAWEGGHHIPFIARWPGKIPAGKTCDQLVCLTDLLATCANIIGTPLPQDAGEDSLSILPLLQGKTDKPVRDTVVLHSNDGKFCIRQGQWKLILCRGSGGWSLPENKVAVDAPPAQLYDLRQDVREHRNLYAEKPQIVAQLTSLLDTYQRQGYSTPRQ